MRKHFLLLTVPCALVLSAFTVMTAVRPEVYFKKGNSFTYETTRKDGEKELAEISIQSITVKGGLTSIVAKDQRKYYPSGRNALGKYKLRYFHDSLNWSQDVLNLLDVGWDDDGPEWTRVSDSLVYPYNMKVGDTLRFATGSEKYKGKTSGFTNRYITVSNRKVVAKESVMVGTEAVDAFRIDADLNQSKVVNMGDGKDRNYKAAAYYREWFSPSKGIVKIEVRNVKDTTVPVVVRMLPGKD